jgi:hypothetical protein
MEEIMNVVQSIKTLQQRLEAEQDNGADDLAYMIKTLELSLAANKRALDLLKRLAAQDGIATPEQMDDIQDNLIEELDAALFSNWPV